MKKLILALAAVGAAVSVQAASVTWGSGKLFTAANADGGFSSTAIKGAASAYLFTLSALEYDAFLADYNANGNMAKVYEAYKGSLDSATASGMTKSLTSASALTTEANVGDTVYGALIYVYHDETLGKDFYIANIGSGTIGSEAGITVANLGTIYLGGSNTTATGGWQAVPEPTSAILVLLGVAGLALKRKRA